MVTVSVTASLAHKAKKLLGDASNKKTVTLTKNVESQIVREDENWQFSDYDFVPNKNHNYGFHVETIENKKNYSEDGAHKLRVFVSETMQSKIHLLKNIGKVDCHKITKTYWLSDTEAVIIAPIRSQQTVVQKVLQLNYEGKYVNMCFSRKYHNVFQIDHWFSGEMTINGFDYVSLGFSVQQTNNGDSARLFWVVLPKDPRVAPRIDRLEIAFTAALDSTKISAFFENVSYCSETQELCVPNFEAEHNNQQTIRSSLFGPSNDLLSFNLKNIQHFQPCDYLIDFSLCSNLYETGCKNE